MKKRLSFEQTLIVLGHLKPPILVAYVEKKQKQKNKQTNKQKENSFRVQSESTRIRQK